MFTTSTFNNNNASSPIFNLDNSMSYFQVDDTNLDSKQDDPLYPCYPLFSPYYYNDIFENYIDDFSSHNHHDHLEDSIEQQMLRAASSAITDDSSIFEVANKMESSKKMIDDSNNMKRPRANHSTRRRRSSKKDRHSKIKTAQGLRDRRMRLSLEVARPFFKLQDMLGYDKASKTVEWLLMQSNSAIEEVVRSKKQTSPSGVSKCTTSSTSDCEVESINIDQENKGIKANSSKRSTSSLTTISTSKSARVMKPKRNPKITTKQSRSEARARARMRTNEKKRSRQVEVMEVNTDSKNDIQYNYNHLQNPINNMGIEIRDPMNGSFAGIWNPLTTFQFPAKC